MHAILMIENEPLLHAILMIQKEPLLHATVRLAKTIQLSYFHTLAYFSVMLQAIRTSKVPK